MMRVPPVSDTVPVANDAELVPNPRRGVPEATLPAADPALFPSIVIVPLLWLKVYPVALKIFPFTVKAPPLVVKVPELLM